MNSLLLRVSIAFRYKLRRFKVGFHWFFQSSYRGKRLRCDHLHRPTV